MRKCVLLAVALFTFGCTASVTLAPGMKYPLPISDQAPAFVFPVDLAHLNSKVDQTALMATVTAGVTAAFGGKIIMGQPLFDLVGNLSWELAETIDMEVKQNTWTMAGPGEAIATRLSEITESILNKLAELNLIPRGYRFKYIIAVHSHGQAQSIAGKEMLTINTWGGVYDIESKGILAYINSVDRIPNDDKSPLATIPAVYKKIISALIGK